MSIHVENICSDFLAFWDAAEGRSPAEQERLWRTLYEEPHREIFDVYYSGYGGRGGLEAALGRFGQVAPRIQALLPHIEPIIHRIGPDCAALFQLPEPALRYVLMVGLFASDSWVTFLNGQPTCFLALELDENSRLRNVEITIAHESAHCFHAQCCPVRLDHSVGQLLLSEGLAVLVSTILSPGAPEAAYLCPGGERTRTGQACAEWVGECNRKWSELRERLLQGLGRTDAACLRGYFAIDEDTLPAGVPMRAGYVAGYRVVNILSQQYSVAEMARWSEERTLVEVQRVLTSSQVSVMF